jgi:hypothetical protein
MDFEVKMRRYWDALDLAEANGVALLHNGMEWVAVRLDGPLLDFIENNKNYITKSPYFPAAIEEAVEILTKKPD